MPRRPSGSHYCSSDLIRQVHERKDFIGNQSEYILTDSSDGEILFGHDGGGCRKGAKGKCQKYILLLTQRSGSTWTCQLLNVQNKITYGGERTKFSYRRVCGAVHQIFTHHQTGSSKCRVVRLQTRSSQGS